ncbi:Inner membrane protein YbaN [Posidoniimonas polymericola]|uniref:Inner membrane protein YbaN n=1 Tax=Posidoniimonas polymericola TaxID=2528002 RepID=A0A5C5YMB3_9BACT|nr:YbaN family protein [Posidoniimonas polymericola]TWT75947.1 Inner membrane protein YbaN [Posidoniimonas polymericola]
MSSRQPSVTLTFGIPAVPDFCVTEDAIRVRCKDVDAAGIVARRLLRSADVRSVVYDAQQSQAKVCLRSGASASRILGEVALLANNQTTALKRAAATLRQVDDVVTWTDVALGATSYVRAPSQATGLKRALLLFGAAASFALAAIGVVVPGLPTTPLLLITSYCLLRTSRTLHQRLINSRVFGPFLKDWHAHRAVRPGVKPTALATMALVLAASLWLGGLPAAAKVGILAMAAIGALVVLRIPVIKHT